MPFQDASQSFYGRLFTYSYNNPVNYTDPSGHFPWVPVIIVGAAVGGGILLYNHYKNIKAVDHDPELNRAVRDEIGGALVSELADVVSEQSKIHGISEDLINGVIRHESGAGERRIFGSGSLADAAEYTEAFVRYVFGNNDASIGIGQIQTRLATELGELGYAPETNSIFEVASNLLNKETAVEYIAGNLHYQRDQLESAYGPYFSNQIEEKQHRLILIGYNQGASKLRKNINDFGMNRVIDVSEYDNRTMDDYMRWKHR